MRVIVALNSELKAQAIEKALEERKEAEKKDEGRRRSRAGGRLGRRWRSNETAPVDPADACTQVPDDADGRKGEGVHPRRRRADRPCIWARRASARRSSSTATMSCSP